jgi:dienelactone hydrolase
VQSSTIELTTPDGTMALYEAIPDGASNAPVDGDAVIYEGADHGFFCDCRAEYTDASSLAWRRAPAWLADHMEARAS